MFIYSFKDKYPPYNITQKNQGLYELEIAVAGFSKEHLDVSLTEHSLVVSGKIENKETKNFIYNGLSRRSFVKSFPLRENLKINGCQLKDGILKIELELDKPKDKTVKVDIA